jgi:hypothetical protein
MFVLWTSLEEFLAVPMAFDYEGQYKRVRSWRIIALSKSEVQIQQPGETGESYKFVNVTAAITWARGDGKGKYVRYHIGWLITEQDIVNAGPTGLVTVREKGVPRGKSGKWTWTFTGILTHTNSQTKVVRKFKKEHDGNYYEVIDDIVKGGAP